MHVASSDHELPRATITGWLLGAGRTIRQHYSDWAAKRRELATARALHNATDIELRDMGICRGEIPAVVSGIYRRD